MRQLERTVEQRQAEAAVLSEVATRIHGEEDQQAILDIAIDRILDGLRLHTAWIFLGDQKDRKLRLAAHRGVAPAYLAEVAARGLGQCFCPEVLVTVESGFRDGRVRVVVRDGGPGLPESLDVFQLFVTTKARGTGLGLSIAQQIVIEHGGEISAESSPGQGATFTVSLPSGADDSGEPS